MARKQTEELPTLFDLSIFQTKPKPSHPDDVDLEGDDDGWHPKPKNPEIKVGDWVKHKDRDAVGIVTEINSPGTSVLDSPLTFYSVDWKTGSSGGYPEYKYLPSELELTESVSYSDRDSVSEDGLTIDADTESFSEQPQSRDTESPPLINREDSPSALPATPNDSVSGNNTDADTESLKYCPRGTARGDNQYFRFSYRDRNGKMKHKHIPGGNTTSPIAQARWQQVKEWKGLGASTQSILELIESWHQLN